MLGGQRTLEARLAWTAALVLGGCLLGATFASKLIFPGVGAAVLFPSYAIVTAALLRTAPRHWWIILLAATVGDCFAHVVNGGNVQFVLLAELVNHGRALIAAIAFRWYTRTGRVGTVRDMVAYLVIVVFGAPCLAGLGGAGLVASFGASDMFWLAWLEWSLSNAITALTLLPLLLDDRRSIRVSTRRIVEALALAVSLVVVAALVFETPHDGTNAVQHQLYWIVPFLLWAAVRFGVRGTSAVMLCIALISTLGTISGRGPFVALRPTENLLELNLFLLATSIPAFLLAVLTEQQRRTAADLIESRRHYRSIVEDQTEMICRFRPDGTCTFANRAFCEAFGHTHDELVGGMLWNLLPPEARPNLERITQASAIGTRETSISTSEGVRWQQWRDRGFFDASGAVLEYQVVGRDITDRKRAEDDRRELETRKWAEATLREADRSKDEFLAMLGHELRNPLTPIAIALQVLLEAPPSSSEATAARESMKRQLGHMTRLLDDLLDISRITLGKIDLRFESVEMGSVIANAVEVNRLAIDSYGHELAIDLPAQPVLLRGDSIRLTQVVANLLSNAAKYTEPRGRIDLAVVRTEGGIRISVRDNGIGLAPESMGTIFELFAQAPGNRATQGLGIGLTLVKKLVELHGGRVKVRSEGLARGTEVVVELPAETVDPPQIASAIKSHTDSRPLRILAVDDNIDIAKGLEAILKLWGHTVRTAHDGHAALEVAAAFDPEVVLLDVGLPRINGLEVARRLRAANEAPALLISISGFGDETSHGRISEAGFHHHLVKPIDLDTLRTLLEQLPRASAS